MKFHDLFRKCLNCSNSADTFHYLINTLTDSITLWNYFVNWNKVIGNFQEIEIYLNLLNYLVGKDDIENEVRFLIRKHPKIVSTIPILIASRNIEFKVLTNYRRGQLNYKDFNFSQKEELLEKDIDSIIEFMRNTELLNLFQSKRIKSIPDYVFGIEVGLDSNGRKNRGGTTMETIVESLLHPICLEKEIPLMVQATAPKIKEKWGIDIKVDKSSRRFDFAIKSKKTLYLIETNFYGGGGSKLKSTAGEYRTLFDYISSQGHQFIWVTDGLGWKKALRPLEETFNYIDYTLNLKMCSTGLLSSIID